MDLREYQLSKEDSELIAQAVMKSNSSAVNININKTIKKRVEELILHRNCYSKISKDIDKHIEKAILKVLLDRYTKNDLDRLLIEILNKKIDNYTFRDMIFLKESLERGDS